MRRTRINEVSHVVYRIGPDAKIPAGRAVRIAESDGTMAVHIRTGEGRPDLCDELNRTHSVLMEVQGQWAQTWFEDRAHSQGPEGYEVAHGEWIRTPARDMPRGLPCLALESPRGIVWVIHEDYASIKLCAELNEHTARILGNGLWLQRRGEGARPLSLSRVS